MNNLSKSLFILVCAILASSCGERIATAKTAHIDMNGYRSQQERNKKIAAVQKLVDEGRLSEAKARLEDLLANAQGSKYFEYQLGLEMAKIEGNTALELDYHRGILNPNDREGSSREYSPRHWTDYGECALKMGEREEAEMAFRSAVKVAHVLNEGPEEPWFTPATGTFAEIRASAHTLAGIELPSNTDDGMLHLQMAVSLAPHLDYPTYVYARRLGGPDFGKDFNYTDYGLNLYRRLANSANPIIRETARENVAMCLHVQRTHPLYKREAQLMEFRPGKGVEMPRRIRGWRPESVSQATPPPTVPPG